MPLNRSQALKKLDAVVGRLAAACFPPTKSRAFAAPRRILLIRPGGIGDAVLIVPAILALKEQYPQTEVAVLAEKRNAAAFSLCPAVDRVLVYDDARELFRAVRGGWDVVIDSEQWHRLSAVIGRLARARTSIGFATNNRARLFVHRVAYSHDTYELESFFDLLAPLGIAKPSGPLAPFLSVPEQAAARAAELLIAMDVPFITVFPGASIPQRRWGAERFRQLVDHLALRGLKAVVVGGAEDAEEGAYIVRRCHGVNLAGKTSLAETAAVIARSLLLVSGDSGVLHIAVGLGVPTVSLFGPGIETKWGPKREFDVVVNRKLSCSPCTRFGTTPPCKEKVRCLSEIAPGEVVGAVLDVLSRRFPE